MPNWIAITVEDLENAKVAALVTSLRTAALAAGQTDRAPEHIQKVVNRIRAEVAACKSNQVDSDPTKIPFDLKDVAERMVLWTLKNSLDQAPSDQEVRDHEEDLAYLRRVARCEIPVAKPDDAVQPDVQPSGSAVQLVRSSSGRHPFGKLGAS